LLICMLSVGSLAWAQTAPSLGSAASFAVLGSSTVTCTGATTINGDVGVSPGSAVTGFPPCTATAIDAADAVALAAHHDAALAYAFLGAETCTTNLTGQDLGGLTLGPGVYCFDSSAQLTGTLTLTGSGPWIFQIGSTLTTGSASSVLVNGNGFSPNCNPGVFWQVGSSATLGSGSQFQGVALALISDTLVSGTNVSGGVFALTGAVTMDTNQVNACSGSGGVTPPARTIKVTGGGEIGLFPGTASFGFNAGTGNGGHFNYVNHVSGLHVDGRVDDVVVIAFNPDGSPKTVLFSGTCGDGCAFSVTVEDHGEPGINDQFGVTVTVGGVVVEFRSQRVISNGNIQFHK
jgi:Ice-binding-like